MKKGEKSLLIPTWSGELKALMHIHKITNVQLANQLGVTKNYVSMVLNGRRRPLNAQQKFANAVNEIIKEKENEQ